MLGAFAWRRMAEREGFEPPLGFPPELISSQPPSASRPSLRIYEFGSQKPNTDSLKSQEWTEESVSIASVSLTMRKKRRFRESVRGGLRHNEKTFRERSARVQSFALFVKISRRQVILLALTVGCAGREHRVNGRVG